MNIRDIYPGSNRDRDVVSHRVSGEDLAPVRSESLFAILWRRKAIIFACTALFILGGFFYIAMAPQLYTASTSMLIDPRLGKVVGADPSTPGYIPDTSAIDSQIKLFTSQTVLSRVAKMAKLADDPEFNGSQRSLLQRLLHPRTERQDDVDLKALEEAITIKRPERTYVVGIDVLARDPKKAAEIANDLTKAYIEDQISSRVDAAQDDTQFVRERLDKLSAQIREAENKVEAYKEKNNIVDASGLRSNEQQVADLTRGLAEARAKTSSARSRMAEIDRMAKSGRLDASSDAVRSTTVERLRQQQAETEQLVSRLATTLGPRHPELMEAKGRQTKLRKLIRDELGRIKLAATGDYKAAQSNENQIVAEVDRLKTQSTGMSTKLVPLEQLERNVRVLRSSFERFAQVNDNLAQQEANSPPGRVIAVAQPPVSPSRPKKTITMLVAAAAGVFFGLAAALFVESAGPQRPLVPPIVYGTTAEAPAPRYRAGRRYWDDDDTTQA